MFPALPTGDNPVHNALSAENATKWKGIFVNALKGVCEFLSCFMSHDLQNHVSF